MGNMSRIVILSNDKRMRSEIQKEVEYFNQDTEISFITAHIMNKYNCNVELQFPRTPGGVRYICCFFDN